MKLKTISQPYRSYADVVAYRDIDGNLVLHPKYFSSSWYDVRGQQRTGWVNQTTGVINPPLGPENEYWGQMWEPEKYKLEDCMFAGDELTFVL